MMASWARSMHRRAATISSVVTSCGNSSVPYPHRMEKVKFGVPLDQVCKNDIPGPLLVLILKLNKEGPYKKDVFRAPGHQVNMKKLIHFLQCGRLVNIDNYSVYTIASVLKKFLRKLPGGIFGPEREDRLFSIIEMNNIEQKRGEIHRLIVSLPNFAQRLLVLLFGTFQVISSTSERAQTGMTSEALGVSVAPSFFQSCVSDGKTAKMEDVLRYKINLSKTKVMFNRNVEIQPIMTGNMALDQVDRYTYLGQLISIHRDWEPEVRRRVALGWQAFGRLNNVWRSKLPLYLKRKVATQIMKFMIDNFGVSNLFGRENYEFYARITGRILKVEEDWIFSFRYPPDTLVSRKTSIEAEKSWLRHEAERWGLKFNLEAISSHEESQSTPTLIHVSEPMVEMDPPQSTGSLTMLPENDTFNPFSTLDENGLFKSHKEEDLSNLFKLAAIPLIPSIHTADCELGISADRVDVLMKILIEGQNLETFDFIKAVQDTADSDDDITFDDLRAVNRYAESTKSLSFLPQVHERQTARMKTRSEWFLNPSPCPSPTPQHYSINSETIELLSNINEQTPCPRAQILRSESYNKSSSGAGPERSEKVTLLRRSSSKEKRLVRRNSSKSKKDKENGKKERVYGAEAMLIHDNKPTSAILHSPKTGPGSYSPMPMDTSPQRLSSSPSQVINQSVTDQDCTEVDVHTYHVTLTYKPRI
ncbi:Rho GTPase-activating protein 20 [Nymphon striatum]|nr:Rho GTPase-activating protein 20 [Nymphon striatum]